MLTKQKKIEKVETGVKDVQVSKAILFGDFGGVKTGELGVLRNELRKVGAKFQVIKKRLLRIIFEKAGVDFNPEQFESQVGTVFSNEDINKVAEIVYKFSKATIGEDKKERFQILGGLNLAEGKYFDGAYVKAVGALPSREILLGQLLSTISGPIRSFLYVLSEKSKK